VAIRLAQRDDRYRKDEKAQAHDEHARDAFTLAPSRNLAGQPPVLVVQRVQSSNLYTQSTCRPLTLPTCTQPAKPLDQHRVGRERVRRVDERVEHLVVTRRRHVEQLANGLFFRASVLPPLTLERKDLTVAAAQAVAGLLCVSCPVCGVRGLHCEVPSDVSFAGRATPRRWHANLTRVVPLGH
jgi:hypothetical protein